MLTAEQAADYLLHMVDVDSGDVMTNLRLQKLLYYAQAWHLAFTAHPLFQEDFEAWTHGPVVRSLYDKFKECEWRSLPVPTDQMPDVLAESRQILDEVWEQYGQFSASYLEELTHQEAPWIEARGDREPGDRCSAIISKDSMRDYYAGLAGAA